MPSKVWDEVTDPFPNFYGITVDIFQRYFVNDK